MCIFQTERKESCASLVYPPTIIQFWYQIQNTQRFEMCAQVKIYSMAKFVWGKECELCTHYCNGCGVCGCEWFRQSTGSST
jgi:hypothetical protein